MATSNAPVIRDPVMLDAVLADIQSGLVDCLPWLDVAFGRAQRLTRVVSGRRIVTPNVYCGGWQGHGENDYIEVSPDSRIGTFSFFDVEDPQTVGPGVWSRSVKAPFGLVVWADLTRVYGEADNRNTERLKAEVMRVLSGVAGWHPSVGRITVARIYERAENIYRGYTLSEIDAQFLMHPYWGMRLEGIIEFEEPCAV